MRHGVTDTVRSAGMLAALVLVLVLVLVVAAGGGDDSSAETTMATAPPTTSADAADDATENAFVAEAIARNELRTGPQTEWDGPSTGPQPSPGVTIAVVATDLTNATSAGVAAAVEEIGDALDWQVTVIDGQGTADGQLTAINQAIALGPDGIIGSGLDAATYSEALCEAQDLGIPFVGFHATGTPGTHEDICVFWSVSQDPAEIGQAMGDFVSAHSAGAGRSTVLYDANYAIARLKAENMRDQLELCTGCELLAYENSPLSEVTTRTPQLFTNWAQQFEAPWYTMTIADYYFDFAVPALRDAGVPTDDVLLVGSDGTAAAYERIRAGEYQIATVPVPERLEAFQTVDEIIRALAGEPPSGYLPPVYVVTADNIDQEGGADNQFDPSNEYQERYYEIWGVED